MAGDSRSLALALTGSPHAIQGNRKDGPVSRQIIAAQYLDCRAGPLNSSLVVAIGRANYTQATPREPVLDSPDDEPAVPHLDFFGLDRGAQCFLHCVVFIVRQMGRC